MAAFNGWAHRGPLEWPRRLTPDSAWAEHIPFAMLLVELTSPSLIVELGTHGGDSYCAFCQAVAERDLECRCFAVDTWEGDDQTGFYGPEVLQDLRAHHDDLYGGFSSLIQARFDDAVGQFADGSIDLLHIDGWHTYESVRHDFDTWRPKLSNRGVAVFHDTNVRERDFGVWRFWAEVADEYPHFEFAHGHGLGVLLVGPDTPDPLREFSSAFTAEPLIAQFFFELGQRLRLRQELARAAREHDRLEGIIALQQEALAEKDRGLALQQEALAEKDRGLALQQEALAEKDRGLAWQQEALAEKDARLAELTLALQALEGAASEGELALQESDRRLEEVQAALGARASEAAAAHAELEAVRQATGFRLLQGAIRRVDKLAPRATRRRLVLLAGAKAARLVAAEGAVGALKRLPQVRHWGPRLLTPALSTAGPHARSPSPEEPSYNDEYQVWLGQHTLSPSDLAAQRAEAKRWAYQPLVSIVMPVFNTQPDWLIDAIESVRAQSYPHWQLCVVDDASTEPGTIRVLRRFRRHRRIQIARLGENSGIAAASNRGLAMARGEFVGFLDHDDELKPNALFEVVKLLNRHRDLDFIYTDEDKRDLDGRLVDPFFKPDWSPDLFMTANYVTHFAVYRLAAVRQAGGFRLGYDGSQDQDLTLRVTETTDRIAHLPLPLYTWRKVPGSAAASPHAKPWAYQSGARALEDSLRRRGLLGNVGPGLWKGSYRIRYAIQGQPSVGIIIPTRDRVDLLRQCVTTIQERSTYTNYEIIVVNNESADPATLEFLASLKGRVIEHPGPFNFAHMMNSAASEALTDMLLFLNNDTEVVSPGWIEALLEYAQQVKVGAVGARLLYPAGNPQHEGIIMGLGRGTAGNVNHGDYFSLGKSVLNASAVTAACMMTRHSVFSQLGGFDEGLAVAFNDVDFCLRARQAGFRVVYTPYAELYHHESASRGSLHPPKDEAFFRARWGNPGDIVDPFYNPNLDISRPYRIDIGGTS